MFVVTGPSGGGKTTTCRRLVHTLPECVVLESDILWGTIDMSEEDGLSRYWDLWLRLVVNIHQAGRPVVLCGTVVPSLLESRPSRRCFSAIHYAALTCDDAELERRLRERPPWRGCDADFIADHLGFNRWFRTNGDPDQPAIELIDSTHATVEETAGAIRRWVRSCL